MTQKTTARVAERVACNEYRESGIEWIGKIPRHWHVKRARVGDIVMARRGEIGRCCVVGPDEAGWLCGTGSMLLRLRECDASYFSMLFGGAGFSQSLALHAVGTTMANLNPMIVGRMLVPVPPLSEQMAMKAYLTKEAGQLAALEAKIESVIERLQEYRIALVGAAITGKIDVNGTDSCPDGGCSEPGDRALVQPRGGGGARVATRVAGCVPGRRLARRGRSSGPPMAGHLDLGT